MTTQAFYRIVMDTSAERDREIVKRATAAVLRALRDRLTPAEADQVAAQLPLELKNLWEEAPAGVARPVKMHRQQFYERVTEEAGLPSTREGRWMTLAVFAALKEQLSPGEAEDVLAQLPKDLKEVWAEAQARS